jgi:hypothetical protein
MAKAATKTMTAEEFFDWMHRPDVLPDFRCRVAEFFAVPREDK